MGVSQSDSSSAVHGRAQRTMTNSFNKSRAIGGSWQVIAGMGAIIVTAGSLYAAYESGIMQRISFEYNAGSIFGEVAAIIGVVTTIISLFVIIGGGLTAICGLGNIISSV